MHIDDKDLIARMNLITLDPNTAKAKTFSPRKLVLVACPWLFYGEVEFRSQQLGLGYVGAYAQQFGHEVAAFIDPMVGGGHTISIPVETKYQKTNRYGLPDDQIVARIPANADMIGINAPFTDSRIALYPLVRAIKKRYPSIPVVVGGVLATTLPREVLEHSGADAVIKGEGEVAFSRMLNGEPWEAIPGLLFRKPDGTVFEHPQRAQQLGSVDLIPEPGYNFRPMEEYVRWSPRGDQQDRTLSLISSRGCPFTCEFCSIPEKGQKWRPFNPDRVLAEIKQSIDAWGVNHIEFEDDNFTLQEDRALKVLTHLAELRKKGYPITCSFPNGIMIDKMTESLAVLLKDAGADIIYLPVEAGDPRILIAMDKPMAETHLAQTLKVAEWCVKAGLTVSCFFIVAYPGGKVTKRIRGESLLPHAKHLIHNNDGVFMKGEDEESFEITMSYCHRLKSLGVQGITPLIATPYPGTELYVVCEQFDWLAHKDEPNVLTTVSYSAVTPDRIQIETPYCSKADAYRRWHHMLNTFPAFHNVRKDASGLVDTKVLREKQLLDES